MYEKPIAESQHLETKQGRDTLVEHRLLKSHYCEDICGKAKHSPKMFAIDSRYMKILIPLYKTFLKSHVKYSFLLSMFEC